MRLLRRHFTLGRRCTPPGMRPPYTIHPNNAECVYLRLLLINVRWPTSFKDLQTVNDQLCDTYREACQKFFLKTIHIGTLHSLMHRTLLSHGKYVCYLPSYLQRAPHLLQIVFWKIQWLYERRHFTPLCAMNLNPYHQFTSSVYDVALIEDICLAISNKLLAQWGMDWISTSTVAGATPISNDHQQSTRTIAAYAGELHLEKPGFSHWQFFHESLSCTTPASMKNMYIRQSELLIRSSLIFVQDIHSKK